MTLPYESDDIIRGVGRRDHRCQMPFHRHQMTLSQASVNVITGVR